VKFWVLIFAFSSDISSLYYAKRFANTMNSMYSDISEPSISQGSDADGPSATATLSYQQSSSAYSVFLWFFIIWIVLFTLIAALVYVLIECRCRQNPKQQQRQEVHETVVAVASRRRKVKNGIVLTIQFAGSLIGLGLSIYSIVTCEFITLDSAVTLDAFFVDQLSVTIYNLGLWKVDIKTNSVLSGCVNAGILQLLDTPYKFARASAIMGAIFGGTTPVILLYLVLNRPESLVVKVRYLLVLLYLLSSLFQLATLAIFGTMYCDSLLLFEESGNNCRSSIGVIASISAALYWMLEVVAAACLPFSNT
jgi:hypothetical protein